MRRLYAGVAGASALAIGALLATSVLGADSVKPHRGTATIASHAHRRPFAARIASATRYQGLSGAGAVAVGRRRHPEMMSAPIWRPVRTRAGESVTRYVNDHTARVALPDGHRALVRSALPLRAPNRSGHRAPADLTLRDTGHFLEPVNPLASTRIARTARGGFSLPDVGIRLAPAGALRHDSRARVAGGRVVYPNALLDTDLVVVPQPAGAETYAQLRSKRSPEDIRLRIHAPAGTRVVPDKQLGGIALVLHGHPIAHLSSPAAWDADKQPVRSTYAIHGRVLAIHVSHRSAAPAYPVVVDPAVEERWRDWRTNTGLDFSGWNYENVNTTKFTTFFGNSYLGNGLYMYNRTSQTYNDGDTRRWFFNVLGFGDAFIYRVDFTNLYHEYGNTCLTEGIFSRTANAYEPNSPVSQCAGVTSYPSQTVCVKTDCTPGGTKGNAAMFGIQTVGTGIHGSFTGYLGGASIWEYDTAPPVMTNAGFPASWVETASGMTVSGTDTGLGMQKVVLDSPTLPSWDQNRTKDFTGCGDRNHRCPKIAQPTAFASGNLPEGVNTVRAVGTDVIGDSATATWPLKIDKSAPAITGVSGSLYAARNQTSDHRDEGIYGPSATLHVDATDSRSGVKSIEVAIDDISQAPSGGLVSGACAQDGCPKTLDWTLNSDSLTDTDHKVTITVKDQVAGTAGSTDTLHTTTQTFFVTVDRRGDVFHAEQYEGDPTNGDQLADEWAQQNTYLARREEIGAIATRDSIGCTNDPARQCAEVRYRSRNQEDDPNASDDFSREVGTSVSDANLDLVADIQEPSKTDLGTQTGSGSLNSALQPWQTPPPGHGSTYLLYEDTTTDTIDDADTTQTTHRIWIDGGTRYPLREQVTIDGEIDSDVFYTYDKQRTAVSDHPSDFFAVAKPTNTDEDTNTDYNTDDYSTGQATPESEPATQSQQTAEAVDFRSAMGFNADPAFVASTFSDPSLAASVDRYGIPLTPDEQNEMTIREAIQSNISSVRQYGLDRPSEFAGEWIDQANGGLVYTAWTGNALLHEQDLKALFPFPERIRTVTVTATLAQLDAVRDQIAADRDSGALAQNGFDANLLVVDESTDTVKVGISAPTPLLTAKLKTTYGPSAELVQADREIAERRIPPLVGGLRIETPVKGTAKLWSLCSSAYALRFTKTVNGKRRRSYQLLTAGHCGQRGSKWKWRLTSDSNNVGTGHPFGRMNHDTLATHPSSGGTHIDAASITERPSYRSGVVRLRSNKFKTISGVQERPTGGRHQPNEGEKGDLVCMDGATSFYALGHQVCGPLQFRDMDVGFQEGSDKWTTRHEDQARLHSRGGDSGSSVFTRSSGIALGELTGGGGNHTDFQEIGYALQALGDPTVVLGTPRKSAPAAATSAASNVTLNAARLNGSVNPHDLATTYQFNWGTTTGYGNTTPAKSAGSDRSDHKAFADISGLAPNTTYHFRIVATNAIGSRTGKDVTFTTTPGP